MRYFSFVKAAMALLVVAVAASCSQPTAKIESSVPAEWDNGVITLQTPERAPGQQSALGLTVDPIDTVRIAFVGVGGRGTSAVKRFTFQEGVKIVALCELEQEKLDRANGILREAGLPEAATYVGEESYQDLCNNEQVDLVYICTDWLSHVPIAVYAMEHGINVAVEVPAAMTIEDCWKLVDTCEKTRKHCMMLENCCYDFFEATCLNMAQQGLFGEICHVEGAYIHYLLEGMLNGGEAWRLEYDRFHRGDNYPTHGLGPVCQLLDIHRGDKMDYLVSMDTKSFSGSPAVMEKYGDPTFKDGDHTITLIRTQKEKVIEIQHNVYTERPYNRMYQITGTEGFANKYPSTGISLKEVSGGRFLPDAAKDSLLNVYKPEIIKEIEEKAREVGGHGGMDFIMDYRLIYCLRNGLPLDEDVYDAAEWSCLTELSAISLENNSAPVRVPDFTRGDWDKVKGFRYATK